MATRTERGVSLARAAGIRNIFAKDWKRNFFNNRKKKIASIPFLRNLVEMTTGEADNRYDELTSMLHWKTGSDTITIGRLDGIYNSICQDNGRSRDPQELVYDVLIEEAKDCLAAGTGMNLENKIVLAIAIRLLAERHMIHMIADPAFVAGLEANQAHGLLEEFKRRFPSEDRTTTILERVSLMTPENIHVNSFMYEPIIDMSDDHLRKLFADVKELH